MTKICRVCSRANPAEARYCWFDGLGLDELASRAGPVDWGTLRFMMPFVFPSGKTCCNFDELALTCHTHREEAQQVLKQGFLGRFLAGVVGRTDLAQVAKQVGSSHDTAMALDQFLGKLPSVVLTPARLQVNNSAMSLGTLQPGHDQRCELVVENRGMRLLHGTVTSDADWLGIDDGTPRSARPFRCLHRLAVPLRVNGRCLRASNAPLEAHVVIHSNGGQARIVVRASVPVRPYPDGVLAGARSPRQLAARIQNAPMQAAVAVERGDVARWYQTNGWTYPVRGPHRSCRPPVHQFFQALGLTPPTMPGEPVRTAFPVALPVTPPPRAIPHARTITPATVKRPIREGRSPWVHLLPVGVLCMALLTTIVRDAFLKVDPFLPPPDEEPPVAALEPAARIALHFHDHGDDVVAAPTMTFGLTMLGTSNAHANDAGNSAVSVDLIGRKPLGYNHLSASGSR